MSTPTTFGSGQPGDFTPAAELNYEQARAELVETVRILETGQMGLDESLKYWERGEALARRCEELLDGARRRVEHAIAQSQQDEGEQAGDSGKQGAAGGQ